MQMEQQYPGLQNELFNQTPGLKLQSNRKQQRVVSQASDNSNNDKLLEIDGIDQLADIDLEGIEASEQFQFFVDEYQDEQIQEIISIFRNDFKPPKNLWIEKNPQFNQPDYYQEIYSQAIEQYNQQQMQLQQKQQQEMQLQVSNSPKPTIK